MEPVLELLMALKTAQREVERRFNHLLRPLGVTAVQAEALLIIADGQPVSIADLGARMAADPGHPSRLADRLAAAGWIDRRPSPRDGRRTDLTLTPDGRDLVERIVAARRPYLERTAAALAETGLDGVLPDLRRLLDLVRALPEPDDRPGAPGPE
ncbi:MarR family winged helix-turn-helix transcriptional regulator [Actinomadura nitritigenes]|uniref:MarR family winged helix-turn-helix transcriptional regulator n=1 Tax=Actinomadura nitritigenes TaxID=134602 RepID=UPI003D8B2594